MTGTATVEQMARDIESLKLADEVRKGNVKIPSRAEYFQSVATAQAHRSLVNRARAEAGAKARAAAEQDVNSRRLKIEDRLVKIERERQAALEKFDLQRRQLVEHYDLLRQRPEAALAELDAEIKAAGKAAEAAVRPEDVALPKVSLEIDRSEEIAALERHQKAQRFDWGWS